MQTAAPPFQSGLRFPPEDEKPVTKCVPGYPGRHGNMPQRPSAPRANHGCPTALRAGASPVRN